jgi:hypothetical protein
MKKLLIILTIALGLGAVSCNKDNPMPNQGQSTPNPIDSTIVDTTIVEPIDSTLTYKFYMSCHNEATNRVLKMVYVNDVLVVQELVMPTTDYAEIHCNSGDVIRYKFTYLLPTQFPSGKTIKVRCIKEGGNYQFDLPSWLTHTSPSGGNQQYVEKMLIADY